MRSALEGLIPVSWALSRESLDMLTTKEAIEQRRSIRKYKPDPIPDGYITELLHSARLAPSGCNAQPWRFKIVREPDVKAKLAQAAHNQSFIAEAPVVMVCCADIQGYIDGSTSGVQDLGEIGVPVIISTLIPLLLSSLMLLIVVSLILSITPIIPTASFLFPTSTTVFPSFSSFLTFSSGKSMDNPLNIFSLPT